MRKLKSIFLSLTGFILWQKQAKLFMRQCHVFAQSIYNHSIICNWIFVIFMLFDSPKIIHFDCQYCMNISVLQIMLWLYMLCANTWHCRINSFACFCQRINRVKKICEFYYRFFFLYLYLNITWELNLPLHL
jgi:hypothetical protein